MYVFHLTADCTVASAYVVSIRISLNALPLDFDDDQFKRLLKSSIKTVLKIINKPH